MTEPKWNDALPRDREGIDQALHETLDRLIACDGSDPAVFRDLIALRQQQFRLEFGREPDGKDPLLWSGKDLTTGAPKEIEVDEMHLQMWLAARSGGVAPDMAYALGVVGIPMTERNAELRPDLAPWWDACVRHYRKLSADTYPPIVPAALREALVRMNFAATHPTIDYAPCKVERVVPAALRRYLAAIMDRLEDVAIAENALTRISLLSLFSPDSAAGFSERQTYAAATARIVRMRFSKKSFRAQTDEFDRYER